MRSFIKASRINAYTPAFHPITTELTVVSAGSRRGDVKKLICVQPSLYGVVDAELIE